MLLLFGIEFGRYISRKCLKVKRVAHHTEQATWSATINAGVKLNRYVEVRYYL